MTDATLASSRTRLRARRPFHFIPDATNSPIKLNDTDYDCRDAKERFGRGKSYSPPGVIQTYTEPPDLDSITVPTSNDRSAVYKYCQATDQQIIIRC